VGELAQQLVPANRGALVEAQGAHVVVDQRIRRPQRREVRELERIPDVRVQVAGDLVVADQPVSPVLLGQRPQILAERDAVRERTGVGDLDDHVGAQLPLQSEAPALLPGVASLEGVIAEAAGDHGH